MCIVHFILSDEDYWVKVYNIYLYSFFVLEHFLRDFAFFITMYIIFASITNRLPFYMSLKIPLKFEVGISKPINGLWYKHRENCISQRSRIII